MLMIEVNELKQLYDVDDDEWLEQTINLLKNHQFQQLDLDNLIEELEDLGREKKNAVASLLEQIIRHLLLLQYWTTEAKYNAVHRPGACARCTGGPLPAMRRLPARGMRNWGSAGG